MGALVDVCLQPSHSSLLHRRTQQSPRSVPNRSRGRARRRKSTAALHLFPRRCGRWCAAVTCSSGVRLACRA